MGGERETTGLVTGERRSHEHRAIQKDIQALWRLRPTKSLITAVSASEANKAWRCGRQRERAEPLTALMIYLMIAVSERTRKKLLVRALASYVLYHVAPILKAGKKITEKQKKIVPKSYQKDWVLRQHILRTYLLNYRVTDVQGLLEHVAGGLPFSADTAFPDLSARCVEIGQPGSIGMTRSGGRRRLNCGDRCHQCGVVLGKKKRLASPAAIATSPPSTTTSASAVRC